MRSPLRRAVQVRLESGRLVVLSLGLGVLVGLVCVPMRTLLVWLSDFGLALSGYSPPGVPGAGGLLMVFGTPQLISLLGLTLVAFAFASLVPPDTGEPLSQLVRQYHRRRQNTSLTEEILSILGNLLAHAGGLLVGRDTPFIQLGNLSARLLARLAAVEQSEVRILSMAGAAAALGTALHAPLAAAVLMAEVVYRKFEFEADILLPCLLSTLSAYAVYGLAYGFESLFHILPGTAPTLEHLPALSLLTLLVTGAGWLGVQLAELLPAAWSMGRLRLLSSAAFGLLTAATALWLTPAVLGDGAGWVQLSFGGFLDTPVLGLGLLRWVLFVLGARLAFGGGILPSAGVGGLLGSGLGQWLGLDPILSTAVGVVAFLTVTLNTPVAAALLVVGWGGYNFLPIALLAAGVAHLISGEKSLLASQQSGVRRNQGMTILLRDLPAPAPTEPEWAIPAEPQPHPTTERQLYRQRVPTAWLGARLDVVSLPAGLELVGLVRSGQVQTPLPQLRLKDTDDLLLLATPDSFSQWQALITGQSERMVSA